MQRLAAADYLRMPWKNGGGETFQIAASPAGATLDAIDWRLSMAIVATDGPFSSFAGMDRTLTVLDGTGLRLRVEPDLDQLLRPQSAPFAFPADGAAQAWLLAGPVTDLNVLTRRGRFRHQVQRLMVEGGTAIHLEADVTALFCCSGAIDCRLREAVPLTLRPRDCALIEGEHTALQLHAPQAATALLVEIYRTTL